ncbi:MAG: cupin domain-containing protein [Anaerolineae bacterium]|nr:cupin domain-containing protein [Anaerolineae bacterium]
MNYTWFENLPNLVTDIPAESIVSRTIYADATLKAVLFGFAAGQALSEHSAAQPAIIHILSGSATIQLGDDTYEAESGAWVHMSPRLAHSVIAKTPVRMLLLLLKQDSADA